MEVEEDEETALATVVLVVGADTGVEVEAGVECITEVCVTGAWKPEAEGRDCADVVLFVSISSTTLSLFRPPSLSTTFTGNTEDGFGFNRSSADPLLLGTVTD